MGCCAVGCHFGDLREDTGSTRRIAIGQHLLAHGDELVDLLGGLRRLVTACLDRKLGEDLVERLLQLRFAAGIGQVGDRLALEHRIDGRDRLDLELGCNELFLVDIDLHQHHALVGIVGRNLFQQRGQRLAGPAPVGIEIEDDELRHRRFDDVLLEPLDCLLLVDAQSHARH